MTRGRKILLWVGGAVGVVAFVVFVLPILVVSLMFVWPHGEHTFLETEGDKATAYLARPGGSMEPIYYSVWIDGPGEKCRAAELGGYEAEEWVRLAWTGPEKLRIEYGLPQGYGMQASAPAPARGEDACAGYLTEIAEDPLLALPPSHSAPGFEHMAEQAATRSNEELSPNAQTH